MNENLTYDQKLEAIQRALEQGMSALVEAMKEIDENERRIDDLEAALRPFANEAFMYDPPEDDDTSMAWQSKFHIGLFRRARSVLGTDK